MRVTIRRIRQQDYPVILSLLHEFARFQQTPDKVTISLQDMYASGDLFQGFVAVNETEQVAGFASFYFVYNSWSGKGLYLDDLYVSADFRKQGIGKNLLDAVIELARSENCKKLKWQVSKWNRNAIEFYKKNGAIVDDTEINCDFFIKY